MKYAYITPAHADEERAQRERDPALEHDVHADRPRGELVLAGGAQPQPAARRSGTGRRPRPSSSVTTSVVAQRRVDRHADHRVRAARDGLPAGDHDVDDDQQRERRHPGLERREPHQREADHRRDERREPGCGEAAGDRAELRVADEVQVRAGGSGRGTTSCSSGSSAARHEYAPTATNPTWPNETIPELPTKTYMPTTIITLISAVVRRRLRREAPEARSRGRRQTVSAGTARPAAPAGRGSA